MTTYPPPPQCVNDCANCGAWCRKSCNLGGDDAADRLSFLLGSTHKSDFHSGWRLGSCVHFSFGTKQGRGEEEARVKTGPKRLGVKLTQTRGKGDWERPSKKSPATLQRALWRWSVVTHTYHELRSRNARLSLNLSQSVDFLTRSMSGFYFQSQLIHIGDLMVC